MSARPLPHTLTLVVHHTLSKGALTRRGYAHVVRAPDVDRAAVAEWLADNLTGRHMHAEPLWGFTDPNDALSFKMRFG